MPILIHSSITYLKHKILVAFSCLKNRLINWLEGTAKAYQTEAIDQELYKHLNNCLREALTTNQVALINTHLLLAHSVLVGQKQAHAIA